MATPKQPATTAHRLATHHRRRRRVSAQKHTAVAIAAAPLPKCLLSSSSRSDSVSPWLAENREPNQTKCRSRFPKSHTLDVVIGGGDERGWRRR
ncbi:hypothetical protein L2E82_06149 [Cichorium intybus]|uniref:Uncharacterized protein n=1 Tax=Cichorium intybus TaxID=13427 RepID=A0ACB9H9B0_CICIN|nr:hypothetical protein L2E82_06149 [Cichorium intybus]